MKKNLSFLILLCIGAFQLMGSGKGDQFLHPRGLLMPEDVSFLRQRIQTEPYKSVYEKLYQQTAAMAREFDKNNEEAIARLAMHQSYIYLLSGNEGHAQDAFRTISLLETSTTVLSDLLFRGLNKATVLRNLAITYDLCYNGLTQQQREQMLQWIWFLMVSVSSNMGFEANPPLESNWMGIRWASVMIAAVVWDEMDGSRPRSLPFLWDVIKRLEEHADRNIHTNGWNAESMNYFNYNWSFIAPALIALQNHHQGRHFHLQDYIPNAVNAMWARSVVTLAIPANERPGLQLDFSVDDPRGPVLLFPLAQRLFPAQQLPALRWMNNYLFQPDKYPYDGEHLFYHLIYDDEETKPVNPSLHQWLSFHDAAKGVAIFRNRFRDENDIVAGLMANSKRVRGHQSFDNLGVRIAGLGSLWIVGAGRTGAVAGQSTIFPRGDIATMKGTPGVIGTMKQPEILAHGTYSVSASGSCLGVDDHSRLLVADYSGKAGAEAVFIIHDIFSGEGTWRINTPAFNHYESTESGFILTAPNGSTLRAQVFTPGGEVRSSVTSVRYGGDTQRLNPGICFHGECYENTLAIDIACVHYITVVITLQTKGKEHPEALLNKEGSMVRLGEAHYGIEMKTH